MVQICPHASDAPFCDAAVYHVDYCFKGMVWDGLLSKFPRLPEVSKLIEVPFPWSYNGWHVSSKRDGCGLKSPAISTTHQLVYPNFGVKNGSTSSRQHGQFGPWKIPFSISVVVHPCFTWLKMDKSSPGNTSRTSSFPGLDPPFRCPFPFRTSAEALGALSGCFFLSVDIQKKYKSCSHTPKRFFQSKACSLLCGSKWLFIPSNVRVPWVRTVGLLGPFVMAKHHILGGAIPMNHQAHRTSYMNPGFTSLFRPQMAEHKFIHIHTHHSIQGMLKVNCSPSAFFSWHLMLTAVLFLGQRKWPESVQLFGLARDV